jgi:hypothetical protein
MLTEEAGGRKIYIDNIEAGGGGGGIPNSIGPRAVRGILRDLKTAFPGAESIGGFRVSGARYVTGSGAKDVTVQFQKVEHDPFATE